MAGKLEIKDRFLCLPKESFFLFGPRGTGKSTWIKRIFHDSLLIDLLDPAAFRAYSSVPERLRELVEGNPGVKTILIDEVQKVPEILSVVHLLIEKYPFLQFVLTGSSARKLKRTGTDLMAGRATVRKIYPFMGAELGDDFNLENSLQLGLLPLILDSRNPDESLKAYAALYIREEVQMEGLVRSIGNFSRFLEIISFSHASILNISNIARETQVGRKTIEGYVSILEDILLAFRLEVFRRKAKRKLTEHPKFYFMDTGVFRSLRPTGPLDKKEEINGQALEGLVAQHLISWVEYRGRKNKIYYWRTRSGMEVDFVIYGDDGLWGIEVKNTDKIRLKDFRGLKSFQEEYPDARTMFLYRGKEKIIHKNVLCLPVEQFLSRLKPEQGLDIFFK